MIDGLSACSDSALLTRNGVFKRLFIRCYRLVLGMPISRHPALRSYSDSPVPGGYLTACKRT
jgi:hypothetical protein